MVDPVKKAERREKALAKLRAMTADQPLEQWVSLLEPENGVRAEVIKALRKVDRRQEDIEQLARHNSIILAAVALQRDPRFHLESGACQATSGRARPAFSYR